MLENSPPMPPNCRRVANPKAYVACNYRLVDRARAAIATLTSARSNASQEEQRPRSASRAVPAPRKPVSNIGPHVRRRAVNNGRGNRKQQIDRALDVEECDERPREPRPADNRGKGDERQRGGDEVAEGSRVRSSLDLIELQTAKDRFPLAELALRVPAALRAFRASARGPYLSALLRRRAWCGRLRDVGKQELQSYLQRSVRCVAQGPAPAAVVKEVAASAVQGIELLCLVVADQLPDFRRVCAAHGLPRGQPLQGSI
jgi:hypothetical protein